MKKFVEKTLEAALIKASTELRCSVADLEYEIVQNPSGGFLGLGKKEAVIVVATKDGRADKDLESNAQSSVTQNDESRNIKQTSKEQDLQHYKLAPQKDKAYITRKQDSSTQHLHDKHTLDSQSIWGAEKPEGHSGESLSSLQSSSQHNHEANAAQICKEIKELFSFLPFEIHHFEVQVQENNTLFVFIDGRDCALLIGEKGYRYKALSYLLFNWINPKYGYSLRLEIAEFLKNQEEMIDVYLKDIVRLVKLNGRAQTKTLDGILVYIALNKLRDIFPDKYVSVRQNEADEKYIIINDFRR